jgi:hypothetical protein
MSTIFGAPVELRSVEVLPGRDAFVVGLAGPNDEELRLEMPAWTVHQLMRLLPRLDAALTQACAPTTATLIAHPVVQWSVQRAAAGDALTLSVQSDRRVRAAFLLEADAARAIHAALGQAIEALSARADRAAA